MEVPPHAAPRAARVSQANGDGVVAGQTELPYLFPRHAIPVDPTEA